MEKKKLISVVKPLMAAALLFGSSGGVAWGQVQMDCKNAFGAGESRYDGYYGTTSLTTDGDASLVNGPIILGGVDNIVGQKWTSGSGDGSVYTTGSPNNYCLGVRFNGYTCHSGCTGASVDIPSQWSGCDNTFFKFYNGTSLCNNRASSILYSTGVGGGPATQVQIKGGTLGSGTAPFDVTTLYFKDIPFTWYEYTRTQGGHHTCHYGGTCTYHDASYSTATNKGYVDGVIYINAGAHVRVAGNVSADGTSNSKATLDLPSSGAQYSLMIDGNLEENKINSQKNGVITNLATMAPKAVIGVYGNYVPGNGIATNAAGGTILIGPNTTGQNKMTITPASGGPNDAYAFDRIRDTTVYTGTWVPADGTSNLGNYGDHDITVDATMKIALQSTAPAAAAGNMSTGKIQIFNMKQSLTYNNFLPNIPSGATGNFLMLAADELKMSTTSTHTSNIAGSGSMTLMGARVTLDKDESITLANG